MADNPPSSQGGPLPPLPSSGTTGRLKSPTTQLPVKKGGAGKIVVMLSSVAKPPPANTQLLPQVTPPADATPTVTSATTSQDVSSPPPLPPKQVTTATRQPAPPKLSTTTYVKLPPKTNVPHWSSLSGKPVAAPGEKGIVSNKAATPQGTEPLPSIRSEPKKSGPQLIPPIKLNAPSSEANSPVESIFPKADQPTPAPKPEGWKSLEAGELNPPEGGLQSLDAFARLQRLAGTPAPETPAAEAKAKPAPLVAPALLPPTRVESPISASKAIQSLQPPPLPPPISKPVENPVAHPLHVAPPMLEKAPEVTLEKLPQPHIEARKNETTPDLPGSPGVHKVPALIQPEDPSSDKPAETLSPKPLLPPTPVAAKGPSSWLKKTTPLVLSSTSKVQLPPVTEAKPALKPAVLPRRSQPIPDLFEEKPTQPPPFEPAKAADISSSVEKMDAPTGWTPATESVSPPRLPGTVDVVDKNEEPEAKDSAQLPPESPSASTTKAPIPLTRAERARKRRFWNTIAFYVLFAGTLVVLLLASLHFCRDTRLEGQVIPPPGMALSNEVWIVTDFSSEVSGIAEDLAAERTPLMQEIQERQDHVQRAQADIASREERIRLIQQQIQAAKDEAVTLVKKSRDDTQKIWDGEGAQIDAEYQSRFNQLKQTISARAKSLNLKYQPDDSFPSPEVWANAYRLALYEVPAGVDSVKEHQWLGDQMKQWRDFLKTLDDRKEQLREKAAQLKLAPGPRIADLNAKIEDLQQRVESTAAEEVPLKAELQQAQTDLATAQGSDAGLDDKYYKELYDRPAANITKRIPLAANGRFTWVDDNPFGEGEKEHHYWIFARAIRADGRQYWSLHHLNIGRYQTIEIYAEPEGFVSTKAILRPNLTPEEQEQ